MSTQLTTSHQIHSLSEQITGESEIDQWTLSYFRGRLSNRIHAMVLTEFLRQEKTGKITRALLAKRIGRKPEQITRWFSSSGNWTLDTLSDLLLGLAMEPSISVQSVTVESNHHIKYQGDPKLGYFWVMDNDYRKSIPIKTSNPTPSLFASYKTTVHCHSISISNVTTTRPVK